MLQVHIGVGARNQTAIRLYERCGFSVYGRDPRLILLPDATVTDEDLLVLTLDGYSDAVP